MCSFSYETQGANTYMVYEIDEQDKIDTLSQGMISNNRIKGVAPIIFTQRDSRQYFKYNISAQIPVEKFFTGTVTRNRLLGVFSSIASALSEAEEYMIDTSHFLLDKRYIFVDVSSCEAMLVCLPVMGAEETQGISRFFRMIILETQFDQSENCDYVARLLNYFNSDSVFSLEDFQSVIKQLQNPQQEVTPVPVYQSKPAAVITTVTSVVDNKQKAVAVKAIEPVEEIVPEKKEIIPNIRAKEKKKEKVKEKKWSIFGKPGKKSAKDQTPVSSPGFDIPGQRKGILENTETQKAVQNTQTQMVHREQTAAEVPRERKSLDFGNTTVLTGGKSGPTTILSQAMNPFTVPKPHLIRKKTNEKIDLVKPLLRIGKEKSYVDYFVGDNTAISKSHADIIIQNEKYYVCDTNSTNHTYVNGNMIQPNINVEIAQGDVIMLADEAFEFKLY